jgi:uncharacterized membrane protein YhdT
MPFWHRAGITLLVIVVASWVVVTLIEAMIGWRLPGYLAGVVGGVAGVPAWEMLRRVQPKSKK